MDDFIALANSDELADLDRLLETFEQSLEYFLRLHLKRRHSFGNADMEVEMEKIQLFLRTPIPSTEPEAA